MVPTSPRPRGGGPVRRLARLGSAAHAVRVCRRTSWRVEISTILPGAGGRRNMKNRGDRGGANLGRTLRSVSGYRGGRQWRPLSRYRGGRAAVIGLPGEGAGAGEVRSRRGSLANSRVLAGYRGRALRSLTVGGSLTGRCPVLNVFIDWILGPGELDNGRASQLAVSVIGQKNLLVEMVATAWRDGCRVAFRRGRHVARRPRFADVGRGVVRDSICRAGNADGACVLLGGRDALERRAHWAKTPGKAIAAGAHSGIAMSIGALTTCCSSRAARGQVVSIRSAVSAPPAADHGVIRRDTPHEGRPCSSSC